MNEKRSNKIDPITMAILNKRFDTITTKMANTLLRTGRSGVLNMARDFSTSIITRNCELLTGAESLPIHCLSGADIMAKTMVEMHPTLRNGDAFLHNSPYHGCSHPADHTILVPVIDAEDGIHHFTVWVKVHQADCGNSQPTTYSGDAIDLYNEGALIFPAVKIQENYEDNMDIIRMCEMRIRVPEQWRGDYLATVGAARVGEKAIINMASEFGWETLHAFAAQWLDYSEDLMIDAVKKLPAGQAVVSSIHDPVPGTPADGVKITSDVVIDKANGLIKVDLSDNPDTMPCGLNLSEACARTGVMIGIFNSIKDNVPTNAGSFRRIQIKIREGSITGGGKHPTSMSVATTNLADRVTNTVQRAFSQIQDGLGLAECGPDGTAAGSVISGIDSRFKEETYVNQVFMAFTGGAATAETDAWFTICHPGNAGMSCIDSVELDELHFPVIIKDRHIICDTEGSGRQIGAPSAYCEFGPIEDHQLVSSWVADGTENSAKGTRGGHNGSQNRNYLRKKDGTLVSQPACATIQLQSGERLVTYCSGGGGYGNPWERAAEQVKNDVSEGYVSLERAREVYGVIFDKNGEIDTQSTEKRRRELTK